MKIALVHGPNLRSLGRRQVDLYGPTSYQELVDKIVDYGDKWGMDVLPYQSNHEGDLVDFLERVKDEVQGVIINPGALAHQSYVLFDALKSIDVPVIEVHITNIHSREEFRSHSITARASKGIISGLGYDGYLCAVDWLGRELGDR